MARKLQILANGKPLALPTDFDISIEESNPYFNGNEMFSYPVQRYTFMKKGASFLHNAPFVYLL